MLGRSARTVKRGPSFREMTEGHLLTKVLHHFMYDENYILDQVTFGSSPVRDSYWKLLNENGLSLVKQSNAQIEKEYASGIKMIFESYDRLMTILSLSTRIDRKYSEIVINHFRLIYNCVLSKALIVRFPTFVEFVDMISVFIKILIWK